MLHEEYHRLISRYLDNELTPEERTELEKHLETCDGCRAKLDLWEKQDTIITKGLASVKAGPGFEESIWKRLNQPTTIFSQRFLILRWLPLTAAAIIIVTIGLTLLMKGQLAKVTQEKTDAKRELSLMGNEYKTLELALAKLNQEKNRFVKELEELNSKYSTLVQSKKEIEQQLEEIKNTPNQTEILVKENEKLREQINKIEIDRTTLTQQLTSLQEEYEKIKNKVVSLPIPHPLTSVQEFNLKDGSQIIALVGVEINVNEQEREVILKQDGKLYLTVAKGDKPFKVLTSAGTITVRGTEFFVNVRKEDKDMKIAKWTISVMILSGIVQLTNPMGDVIGTAGESLYAEEGTAPKKQTPSAKTEDLQRQLAGPKDKSENTESVYGLKDVTSLKYHFQQEHYQITMDKESMDRLAALQSPTPGVDPTVIEMDIGLEVIEKGLENKSHRLKATYNNLTITFWDNNIGFKYDLSKDKDSQQAQKELYSAVCLKEEEQNKARSQGDNSFAARALNFKELLKALAYTTLNGHSFIFELKADGSEIRLVDMDEVLGASLNRLPKDAPNFKLLKQMIKDDALKNIQFLFPPVNSEKYRDAKYENNVLKYSKVFKPQKDNLKTDKSKIVSYKEQGETENFTYSPKQQLISEHRTTLDTYGREVNQHDWTSLKEWLKYSVSLVEVK